jgi:hypothetical protein
LTETTGETLSSAMFQLSQLPGVVGALVASLPGGLVVAQQGNVAWWLQVFTDPRLLEVAAAEVEEGHLPLGDLEILAISPTPLLLCAVAHDGRTETLRIRRLLDRVARLAAG